MTLFHIPTAFLIVGLLYFVMPAVTWVVLSSRRSSAVALWCGGGILFGLGVVLLGLRGHVPEWATFPLANLLMFIGIIQHMQSLRLDLAVPWRTRWIALAALLFVLGFEGIRLGVGDALLRVQYNQSIWAVMYVYVAVLAWRIGHLERSRSARWIAGFLLLLAVAMLTSLIRMSIGLSPPDPLSSSPSNIFLALAGTLAAVIGNIAYVGLAFERSQRQTAEAEKQNRTMSERLAMAANVAAFGVWEYDIGTDLITWDDTMFDIYGIPKITPMQYQLWVDRLHPEDRIRAEHSLQAIINELGREELEYRIIRPDNSIRYIQSIKTSLKDDTHQTIRLIGVNRDITERKRMEIELRNSEARYRSYFELPLTGRAVTSPTEGWLEVNATLCDMLGYTKTELTQMTWEELTYPDDLAADLVQFNRVMSGEIDGYTLEKRFIHKDGHSVHTHLAVNCLRKPDQAVDYIIALILDITERKQAEKSLRESEELLREMSRVAKVGGWNLDLKTHKLTWTEEVYRIREVDPNYQPQLKEGIDAFPPEARPILRESIKCAVNQGVSYDLELPFITAKGNHLWVRTIGNAEKLDGQIVRLFGVFQDITGRKRAEIALRESEEKFRLAFSNANTGMCQSICKEIYCKSTKK